MGSLIGIPLGMFALVNIEEKLILTFLGFVIVSYALYSLFELYLPQIDSPKWAYLFGLLSGLLTGAYNIGGPPIVIYCHCCRWNPETFKGNFQGFALVSLILVNISHVWYKNYTSDVWRMFIYSFPALILGLLSGVFLSRYLNPLIFRKTILILLALVGIRLVLL